MANKEKRISVIVYEKDPCENCPGNSITDCQVCEKDLRYDSGISRAEAVERIKKRLDNIVSEFKSYARKSLIDVNLRREIAEAALDALLSKEAENGK